ncbi:RNA chaperone Hfq [Photobacterium ganghwense]|uniref:RNA chaperone Hfq n=1 Tax=Photobacterium ganghwense TaxID=320778 RepID=UPI001A8FF563|nr:RNA chaperone Hfq [Photobacterium ganghwense]QSV17306.1 RNA chaperone Hfq [Photobacterium ganghwense]
MTRIARLTLPALALLLVSVTPNLSYASDDDLEESALRSLVRNHAAVTIFLINGVKLQGQIENFDERIIVLKNSNDDRQFVYKHAISTIAPSTPN